MTLKHTAAGNLSSTHGVLFKCTDRKHKGCVYDLHILELTLGKDSGLAKGVTDWGSALSVCWEVPE